MSRAPDGSVVEALELTSLAEELLRQRVRRERPNATDDEVEAAVRRWYERRPGAEHGDGSGHPRRLRLV